MSSSNLNWRDRIKDLVWCYDRIYFYSSDPGATAVLKPVYVEAQKQEKAAEWYVEGWSTHAYLPNAVYISDKNDFLKPEGDIARQAIIMGQQVNYQRAYKNLAYFKELGLETIFISDHWKGIAKHFKPSEKDGIVLPDCIYVPDQVAYDAQIQAFSEIGISEDISCDILKIFVHPGLEQSLERIKSYDKKQLEGFRHKYDVKKNLIVMMLDCIQDHEIRYYGFNWKTAFEQAYAYLKEHYTPDTTLLIKPHPRQDEYDVSNYLQKYCEDDQLRLVEEKDGELFVAMADEIWGITTILLVVALKAGKTIKVFMPERTENGVKESNKHIEPYVIK